MAKLSAGILLVRVTASGPEVLLVHPGGPFWARKDAGAWSIPKGEHEPDDDPLATARREFVEELGVPCPADQLLPLDPVRQAGGKVVSAWCGIGEIDVETIRSNTFEMIWPPRSGRMQAFPEVDRAAYFPPSSAEIAINNGQRPLIEVALAELVRAGLLAG